MSVLQVRNLSVRYPTDDGIIQAVDALDFDLKHGEILGLVGESGCGKTAAAMSILHLNRNTRAEISGEAIFDGTNLISLNEGQLSGIRGKSISYVFQEPGASLNPVMPVGAQIVEVLLRHAKSGRKAARARAVELLKRVEIPAAERRVRQYPHELSGGMKQRVMIAMAIACEPRILIADEPTTALDVTVQAGILDLLRSMSVDLGMAILLITHNLGVVADVADRVMVMYGGRSIETGPVEGLFESPRHPYTAGLLAAVPASSVAERNRLAEIPGRVPVLHAPARECTFMPRCGRAIDRCGAERPELEPHDETHRSACFVPLPMRGAT